MMRHLLKMVLVMEIGISYSSMPIDLALYEFLYQRATATKESGEKQ